MAATDLGKGYLASARQQFQQYRELAQRAIAGLGEAELGRRLDPESNSIATIMQHMAGNMLSRWTDFLTSDGEKPTRRRDEEFEDDARATRATLLEGWNAGWGTLFRAIDALAPEDLDRRVTIRSEPHSVVEAINRQLTHYAYHVGQIVFLAKHFQQTDWQSLSIPRHPRP